VWPHPSSFMNPVARDKCWRLFPFLSAQFSSAFLWTNLCYNSRISLKQPVLLSCFSCQKWYFPDKYILIFQSPLLGFSAWIITLWKELFLLDSTKYFLKWLLVFWRESAAGMWTPGNVIMKIIPATAIQRRTINPYYQENRVKCYSPVVKCNRNKT